MGIPRTLLAKLMPDEALRKALTQADAVPAVLLDQEYGLENDLRTAVLAYLASRGIMAWRQNAGAHAVDPPGGPRRWIRYGPVGCGDILGIIPPHGRFLSIETKVHPRKPSKLQWEWMERVKAAGGVAGVAYTLRDVNEMIRRLNAEA